MKKLYFHPERTKLNHMPVFIDFYHHDAITYFLRVAEVLEPQLVEDFDSIIPLYTETEQTHEKQRESTRSFLDNWDIFENANDYHNAYLTELKNAIIRWGQKYNLVNQPENNKTFLEIALWAIPDKRDHPQEIEEKKQFFKQFDKELPPQFYEWSITNVIHYGDEFEATGNKFRPDKMLPFVFTPSTDNLHQINILKREPEAHDFENVLVNYDMDVHFALKGERENVKGYIYGGGWDPRVETWNQFEEKMDSAYKNYKDLYKARSRSFMEKHGYIEGKPKRNKEHFEWMVRYQIQSWSIKEIAYFYSKRNTTLGEDTIRKALISTSGLLGLELR